MTATSRIILPAALATAAMSLSLVGAATAQDRTAFAGGFIADDYFGYVGATLPLPGARPEGGWAVRGTVSAGAYDYMQGNSQIDADYVNAELQLVYQRSGSWGYWNVGAGPRYSSTDLSQPDPMNQREGDEVDAVVSAGGARYSGPWRVAGYSSYGFNIEDYYVRAEVTRALRPGGVRLGVEGMLEGDRTYDRQSVGAVVVFQAMESTEVRLSVGGRMAEGRGDQAYFAIGVSRNF